MVSVYFNTCLSFWILIPCILEYVENIQQNALNSILLYFSFYNGPYMFRQNIAVLGEQLCSFLSHFNINMVGDRQVIGRMTETTYRRASWRTEKVHYQVHTVSSLLHLAD
jgi:hypothetical protein